jgi:NitT/TauT family transport system substrate-binding protein
MKLQLNPPRSPFFKGGILSEGLKPLFGKEGKGRFYSANFWATTLASLLILSLVIAVLDQRAIEAATRVMIGNSTINPRIAPLWIAQEIGYFQKYDIETTLVFVRSTPLLIAAMKSGSIPIAYGGGGGILNASVGESDLKILATFTGKMTNNLIARPGIKTAKDLRGKILGVQSIGGTNWIGALLWLESLGLDPVRDNISIQVIGDQTIRAQALESAKIDAAAVDIVFSRRLEQRGFTVLGDSQKSNIPFVGVDVVSTRNFIAAQPSALENVLKALLESLAFVLTPKNHDKVLEVIMRRLRIADPAPAEEGYQDLLRTMAQKPYPAVEGLRNVQRFTKIQNPRIAEVKVEDLVDNRFIRKLDESGFIDRLYGASAGR